MMLVEAGHSMLPWLFGKPNSVKQEFYAAGEAGDRHGKGFRAL